MIQEYLRDTERQRIVHRLESLFVKEEPHSIKNVEFNQLALRIFQFQFNRCMPFRQLCRNRGINDAAEITDWQRIPCVPTESFKHYRLACFPPFAGEIVFHTSGTTHDRPGIHAMPNTELYDAAAMPWFGTHMVPSGLAPDFVALTATPEAAPHSSLVHMIAAAGERFAHKGTVQYVHANGELNMDLLYGALEAATRTGRPLLILTTAFALVHCVESMESASRAFTLPEGSRIMETGGYKGRSRRLEREELYRRISARFGLPISRIINQYGMTEMSSQFYDRVAGGSGLDSASYRIKTPPPWVRSRVLDPASLRPVEEGGTGVLQHVDLANLDSCSFLLTSDAARRSGDGFDLLGRIDEATARGCSLDYEYEASR